jgi:nitroreductase
MACADSKREGAEESEAADGLSRFDPPTECEVVIRRILSRRSVRSAFNAQPIPRADLEAIVTCGLAAPSSKNARPWRVHVVTDRRLLEELANAVATSEGADEYVPRDPLTRRPYPLWPSTVKESAEVLAQASAGLFVENRGEFSRGRKILTTAIRESPYVSLVAYTFEIIGIGAAIENMWLAANALGVAGAFMGDVVIAEETISKRLGFERDLVGVLALGYSDEAVATNRIAYGLDDTGRVSWHTGD